MPNGNAVNNEPNEELSQAVGEIASLRTEMQGLLIDLKAFRRELGELRSEYRAEVSAIRADMATMFSRQNSVIADNKKKMPGSLPGSAVSTGD